MLRTSFGSYTPAEKDLAEDFLALEDVQDDDDDDNGDDFEDNYENVSNLNELILSDLPILVFVHLLECLRGKW